MNWPASQPTDWNSIAKNLFKSKMESLIALMIVNIIFENIYFLSLFFFFVYFFVRLRFTSESGIHLNEFIILERNIILTILFQVKWNVQKALLNQLNNFDSFRTFIAREYCSKLYLRETYDLTKCIGIVSSVHLESEWNCYYY